MLSKFLITNNKQDIKVIAIKIAYILIYFYTHLIVKQVFYIGTTIQQLILN